MFFLKFSTTILRNSNKITPGFRKISICVTLLNKMEGCVTTINGLKRTAVSPGKYVSPVKRTKFVGITPEKKLTNIKTPTDRPFKVSVEGNIGAGKSTLIKYFSNFRGVETYPEPLDQWRNLNGHNLLKLLYEDMERWLNIFQTYVQFTRLKSQTTPPRHLSTTVQMFERSVQNNRYCFLEMAHDTGLHNADYSVLDKWYRWIRENVNIDLDLIVYLRSSPERVYQRTMERGRPEETGITLEYLKNLHEYHERWLMTEDPRFNSVPVLVLDADRARNDIEDQYKLLKTKLMDKGKLPRSTLEEAKRVKRVLNLE